MFGSAPVYFSKHAGCGVPRAELAEFSIWDRKGRYQVGGVQRGEWHSIAEFRSDADACEYIFATLQKRASTLKSTPEEDLRSAAISAAFDAQMRDRFGLR